VGPKKVGGAGGCNFFRRPDVLVITGAHNFNFAAKFSQNGVSATNFALLDENSLTRRKFCDSSKF